ncbi:MAG: ATP-binding protein [Flammeovirgaceae bacterium]|nr:ATP-binding protein [Flammeovirgaceae bacterium]MDW8288465.1 ATP-binding protein [Flammeovirgaceae bacterium]
MKKIVLYGSESTGKTYLAQHLARHFQTIWIPEFARGYYQLRNAQQELRLKNDAISCYEDISQTAIGQLVLEQAMLSLANTIVFLDTDILSIVVYAKHYFGKVPSWLENYAAQLTDRTYLLTNLDIEWVEDSLRDRPNEREKMHALFEEELLRRGYPFYVVAGKGMTRLKNAIDIINNRVFG